MALPGAKRSAPVRTERWQAKAAGLRGRLPGTDSARASPREHGDIGSGDALGSGRLAWPTHMTTSHPPEGRRGEMLVKGPEHSMLGSPPIRDGDGRAAALIATADRSRSALDDGRAVGEFKEEGRAGQPDDPEINEHDVPRRVAARGIAGRPFTRGAGKPSNCRDHAGLFP